MSGTNWNPNNPATAGIEYFPTRQVGKPLSNAAGVGVKVTSTAAETIAQLKAFLSSPLAQQVVCDVYDASNVWANDGFGALAVPTIDAADSGLWEQAGSHSSGAWEAYEAGGTHAFNYLDDVLYDHMTPTDITNASTDKIRYAPSTGHLSGAATWQHAASYLDANDGSGSVSVSSKRVGRVQIVVVARNAGTKSGTLDGLIKVAGTPYGSDDGPITIAAGAGFTKLTFEFDWNPDTGLPWLTGDIAAFVSGGANEFGLTVVGTVGTSIVIGAVNIIYRVWTERRVSTAIGSPSARSGAWVTFATAAPATRSATNWSKASATDYLFVFSTAKGGGSVSLFGVDDTGISGPGLTGWRGADLPCAQTMIPDADPTLSIWVPALFMVTSAPALGVDAQPYSQASLTAVGTATGVTKQVLAAHSTAAYGGATFLLGVGDARSGVLPDAALVVRIRKVSDDSQVGGDLTINPSDVTFNAQGFALVSARFASNASLASGTAYYLRFTSASVGSPWVVGVASTDSATTTDGTTAAGGTISGSATLNGTADAQSDLLSNVQTAPTAPGTLAQSMLTIANRPALVYGTVPATIGYAHLTWAATSLSGLFGYYEVQCDGVTIALIRTEANSYFNDIDCARNVAHTYRVRVVRADGAVSDWANFSSLTITTASKNHVVIASNWVSPLALAFADVSSGHDFHQRHDDRSATKDYYGRDYPVTWSPAEQSGETFVRDLLVAVEDPHLRDGTIVPDRAVFDNVLALVQSATPPALAYCDGYGRRWLASIACDPHVDNPDGAYIATVTITQVAAAVAPVDVLVPWAP